MRYILNEDENKSQSSTLESIKKILNQLETKENKDKDKEKKDAELASLINKVLTGLKVGDKVTTDYLNKLGAALNGSIKEEDQNKVKRLIDEFNKTTNLYKTKQLLDTQLTVQAGYSEKEINEIKAIYQKVNNKKLSPNKKLKEIRAQLTPLLNKLADSSTSVTKGVNSVNNLINIQNRILDRIFTPDILTYLTSGNEKIYNYIREILETILSGRFSENGLILLNELLAIELNSGVVDSKVLINKLKDLTKIEKEVETNIKNCIDMIQKDEAVSPEFHSSGDWDTRYDQLDPLDVTGIKAFWKEYYENYWGTDTDRVKALGVSFKTECEALGFTMINNPFISYIKRILIPNKELNISAKQWDAIHDASVDSLITPNDLNNPEKSDKRAGYCNILNCLDLFASNKSYELITTYLDLQNKAFDKIKEGTTVVFSTDFLNEKYSAKNDSTHSKFICDLFYVGRSATSLKDNAAESSVLQLKLKDISEVKEAFEICFKNKSFEPETKKAFEIKEFEYKFKGDKDQAEKFITTLLIKFGDHLSKNYIDSLPEKYPGFKLNRQIDTQVIGEYKELFKKDINKDNVSRVIDAVATEAGLVDKKEKAETPKAAAEG